MLSLINAKNSTSRATFPKILPRLGIFQAKNRIKTLRDRVKISNKSPRVNTADWRCMDDDNEEDDPRWQQVCIPKTVGICLSLIFRWRTSLPPCWIHPLTLSTGTFGRNKHKLGNGAFLFGHQDIGEAPKNQRRDISTLGTYGLSTYMPLVRQVCTKKVNWFNYFASLISAPTVFSLSSKPIIKGVLSLLKSNIQCCTAYYYASGKRRCLDSWLHSFMKVT